MHYYDIAKKYLPLSVGPVIVYYLLDAAAFLITFAQLLAVGFLCFEAAVGGIGLYHGVMESMNKNEKFAPINIFKVSPVYHWGKRFGGWAVK